MDGDVAYPGGVVMYGRRRPTRSSTASPWMASPCYLM
jgi:hypothetical protein